MSSWWSRSLATRKPTKSPLHMPFARACSDDTCAHARPTSQAHMFTISAHAAPPCSPGGVAMDRRSPPGGVTHGWIVRSYNVASTTTVAVAATTPAVHNCDSGCAAPWRRGVEGYAPLAACKKNGRDLSQHGYGFQLRHLQRPRLGKALGSNAARNRLDHAMLVLVCTPTSAACPRRPSLAKCWSASSNAHDNGDRPRLPGLFPLVDRLPAHCPGNAKLLKEWEAAQARTETEPRGRARRETARGATFRANGGKGALRRLHDVRLLGMTATLRGPATSDVMTARHASRSCRSAKLPRAPLAKEPLRARVRA